jgi:hypothetical protein
MCLMCLLGNEKNFPDMLAPFQETVSRDGIADREGSSNRHLDLPFADELQ